MLQILTGIFIVLNCILIWAAFILELQIRTHGNVRRKFTIPQSPERRQPRMDRETNRSQTWSSQSQDQLNDKGLTSSDQDNLNNKTGQTWNDSRRVVQVVKYKDEPETKRLENTSVDLLVEEDEEGVEVPLTTQEKPYPV